MHPDSLLYTLQRTKGLTFTSTVLMLIFMDGYNFGNNCSLVIQLLFFLFVSTWTIFCQGCLSVDGSLKFHKHMCGVINVISLLSNFLIASVFSSSGSSPVTLVFALCV